MMFLAPELRTCTGALDCELVASAARAGDRDARDADVTANPERKSLRFIEFLVALLAMVLVSVGQRPIADRLSRLGGKQLVNFAGDLGQRIGFLQEGSTAERNSFSKDN